jgi:hypothetical protein
MYWSLFLEPNDIPHAMCSAHSLIHGKFPIEKKRVPMILIVVSATYPGLTWTSKRTKVNGTEGKKFEKVKGRGKERLGIYQI